MLSENNYRGGSFFYVEISKSLPSLNRVGFKPLYGPGGIRTVWVQANIFNPHFGSKFHEIHPKFEGFSTFSDLNLF